jgi:hypothetical protein
MKSIDLWAHNTATMRSTGATKKVARVVEIVCVVGLALAFGFGISFYYRDLPDKPQPELGRIYPLNNHGYYTYMTKRETVEQEASEVAFTVLFVLAIIIDQFIDPFDRGKLEKSTTKRPPWSHRWGP